MKILSFPQTTIPSPKSSETLFNTPQLAQVTAVAPSPVATDTESTTALQQTAHTYSPAPKDAPAMTEPSYGIIIYFAILLIVLVAIEETLRAIFKNRQIVGKTIADFIASATNDAEYYFLILTAILSGIMGFVGYLFTCHSCNYWTIAPEAMNGAGRGITMFVGSIASAIAAIVCTNCGLCAVGRFLRQRGYG